jgi:hypothetical protein
MLSYTDLLTDVDIAYILSLDEVIAARNAIDAKTSGQVYFTITLTPEIKATLLERIGLDLTAINAIPMRWIKGDTAPHIDQGGHEFENTYLMYLTDSEGEFMLGDESYPISANHAYVFNEGLYHATSGTGTQPRLLLGPMSESGLAVGVPSYVRYIRQSESDIQFSYDNEFWYNFNEWPTNPETLYNSSASSGILKIIFTTDITITSVNQYFICGTRRIQFGSESLKSDGTMPIIYIDGVENYGGLI